MEEYSESVLNAKLFANEFFQICKNIPQSRGREAKRNLRLKYCKELVDFLCRIKSSMIRGNCNEKTFKEKVIKMSGVVVFDLEVWWYLIKSEILNPDDILSIFNDSHCRDICENLSRNLFKSIFLQTEADSCFRIDINSDFMELLLRHNEICISNGSQSVVYNNFLQHISKYEMDENNADFLKNTNIFVNSVALSLLNTSKSKAFLLDVMNALLEGEPISLKDLFYKNEHFLKYEKSIVCKSSEILKFLSANDMILYLKNLLSENSNQLNWENFFHLITLMISNYEEVDLFKQLKTLIQFSTEEALKFYNENLLLNVFILVRHCSFPPTSHFPSYVQWFSSTFSCDSVRPINTKEKCEFFINFLTDIAQYDSPYYLKIHINKVPWVPMEYQSSIYDYVKLVKTRLTDMGESFELGMFDNMMANSSEEFDVQTVLDIFKSTNEIPNCVFEASLFCKSYFEKKFLVTLLSNFEGENSVRHKLIMKLSNLGKIPHSLLLKYKKMI